MKTVEDDLAWRDRYSRAAAKTAPKLAVAASGTLTEGYWVSPDVYFFEFERTDETLGCTLTVRAIASATTGQITEIPLSRITQALSQSGTVIDPLALSRSVMDMLDRHTLAINTGTRHFTINLERWSVLDSGEPPPERALYSPDGRFACTIRGADLWVRDRQFRTDRLMADGAAYPRIAQPSETELATVPYRQNPSPVGLWAPDSKWFLTHRVEEGTLPELSLIQFAPPGGERPRLHRMKYALPEDPLPGETLIAINVDSGRVVDFAAFPQLVTAYSTFSFRYAWFARRDQVWFLRRDRYWKWLELICLNLHSGDGRIVIREEATTGYLDVRPMILGFPNVRVLEDSADVLWYSERDGWGHLYLYDSETGALKNQVTRGPWSVRDIVDVNEKTRCVLFLAGGLSADEDPARRTLCSVTLDGDCFRVLRQYDGDVFVAPTEPTGAGQDRPFRRQFAPSGISSDRRYAVIRESNVARGNTTRLIALDKSYELSLGATLPNPDAGAVREFSAIAADEKTNLHGVLFVPRDFDSASHYPLIDYVYPGPQLPQRPQMYEAVNAAPALSLAELGFAVIMVNTRGTPVGSRQFHQCGYPEWLEPQLADHAAVIRQLCDRYSFLDRSRIGILGHSAGGAAAARAMFDYSELFSVGVAVCGLHEPRLGLSVWADKYSGPSLNRDSQLLAERVGRLTGRLLLISGDLDENVPLSQTLKLADALIGANRSFDLLIVPNESHLLFMTSGYVQRRVWDYFVTYLKRATPPNDFNLQFGERELTAFGHRYAADFR